MIRRYCDSCGVEIADNNKVPFNNGKDRLQTSIQSKVNKMIKLDVEVMIGLNGTANAGDWCKYCILDALQKLDDRPKCVGKDI